MKRHLRFKKPLYKDRLVAYGVMHEYVITPGSGSSVTLNSWIKPFCSEEDIYKTIPSEPLGLLLCREISSVEEAVKLCNEAEIQMRASIEKKNKLDQAKIQFFRKSFEAFKAKAHNGNNLSK